MDIKKLLKSEENTIRTQSDISEMSNDQMIINKKDEYDNIIRNENKSSKILEESEEDTIIKTAEIKKGYKEAEKAAFAENDENEEIIQRPKFQNKVKTMEIDREHDSHKMQRVKEAVNRYQEYKGTPAAVMLLETVIEACDDYTSGKFSIFKFGEAAKRLKQVKTIRDKAKKMYKKLSSAQMSADKQKELLGMIRREPEQFQTELIRMNRRSKVAYAPEVKKQMDEYIKANAESIDEKTRHTHDLVKKLRIAYPTLSYDDAVSLALKHVNDYQLDYNDLDEELGEKYANIRVTPDIKKRAADIRRQIPAMSKRMALDIARSNIKDHKEPSAIKIIESIQDKNLQSRLRKSFIDQEIKNDLDKYLSGMNIFKRAFMSTLFREFAKNRVLREKVLSSAYAQGYDLEEEERLKNHHSMRDDEYETKFI